jgi:glycosyltransferase involved in cell wall biosynthesis
VTPSTPRLSLVLPCQNQEDHIERVLLAYPPVLAEAGLSFEIVVVPNACRDRTLEIARRLAEADPRIRVEEASHSGWGHAVQTGFGVARGSLLAYANSARTDPAWIPRLVDLHDQSAPCLAKVRRHDRGAPLRETGSWLYSLEARLLFGVRARDVNGTPKLFSRALWERLKPARRDDLLDLEIMAKITRDRVTLVELATAGFERHGGRSTTTMGTAVRLYLGALRLRLEMRREGSS